VVKGKMNIFTFSLEVNFGMGVEGWFCLNKAGLRVDSYAEIVYKINLS